MKEVVVETFGECFEREFYKVIKNKTTKNGIKLYDFFLNNNFIGDWQHDIVLKDNVLENKKIIVDILQKNEANFDNIFSKVKSIEFKKEYLRTFVISYDLGVQLTLSINPKSHGSRSNPASGFRSSLYMIREDVINTNFLLNLNRFDNFKDINIDINNDVQTKLEESFLIKSSKIKASSLFKYIKNIILKDIKNLEKRFGAYYGSLKLYKLNITQALIPIYTIKLVKDGLDYKYKINGLTHECDKFLF